MAHGFRPWADVSALCASWVWSSRGRWCLARGRLSQALTAFERAAAARPGALGPLLRLARGYLFAQDWWRAHRTLALAREADPPRFARVVPGWLARVGVSNEAQRRLLGAPPPKEDPSPRPVHPVGTPRRVLRRVEPGSLPLGDCRDLDEYARFRAMPPISEGERESIDWDALLEDLLEP